MQEGQINQDLIQRRLNRFNGFHNGIHTFSQKLRLEVEKKRSYEAFLKRRHNEFFMNKRLEKKEKAITRKIPTSSLVFVPSQVKPKTSDNVVQHPVAGFESTKREPSVVPKPKRKKKQTPSDVQRQLRYYVRVIKENTLDILNVGTKTLFKKRMGKLPDEIDAIRSHQRKLEHTLEQLKTKVFSDFNKQVAYNQSLTENFISKSHFNNFKNRVESDIENIRLKGYQFDQLSTTSDNRDFLRPSGVVQKVGYIQENQKIKHSKECDNSSKRYYSETCKEKGCKISYK